MDEPSKFNRRGSSFVVRLSHRHSAGASSESAPQGTKTAGLQRGLVLIRDGREIAGEGMGFGAPVVKYADGMYFSKTAETFLSGARTSVKKNFHMDSVERAKVGKRLVSSGPEGLAHLYRSYAVFRRPMIKFSHLAKKLVNVRPEFMAVRSRGTISMTYVCHPSRVHVSCDMTKLDRRGCNRIFILNEQGSSFFRKYQDSGKMRLVDDEIGAWEMVKAESATLSDLDPTFSFSLRNLDNATLWRGRETHGDVAWAGLIYEIAPDLDSFDYDIFLGDGGI